MNGIFNYIYNFFYEWLFGTGAISTLAPYAEAVTLFLSLFTITLVVFFAYKLIKHLFNMLFDWGRR